MRKISLLLLAFTFFNCTEKEAPKNVTVTSNPIEGGTVAPPTGEHLEGEIFSFSATANSGYEFLNWSGDLSGSDNPASVLVDADKSITANFGLLDSEAPSLVVSPSAQTIEVGGTFTLPQVSASDGVDGDLSSSVTVSGEDQVDTDVEGSYEITYTFTDAAGNIATATHTVNVIADPNGDDDLDGVVNINDNCPNTESGTVVDDSGCADVAPPVITLEQTELTIEAGDSFTAPIATASDLVD